jgi:hypothetical protein
MRSKKFNYDNSDHKDSVGNVRQFYPKYTLGVFEEVITSS